MINFPINNNASRFYDQLDDRVIAIIKEFTANFQVFFIQSKYIAYIYKSTILRKLSFTKFLDVCQSMYQFNILYISGRNANKIKLKTRFV